MSPVTLRSALVSLGFEDRGAYVVRQCSWKEVLPNGEWMAANWLIILNPENGLHVLHAWQENGLITTYSDLCWRWPGRGQYEEYPEDLRTIALAGAIAHIPDCFHRPEKRGRIVQWSQNENGFIEEALKRLGGRGSSDADGS